jgi:hypothetical protein
MSDWIFQASPAYYDADGAVRALPELAWLVKRYRHEIKAGDRAFIWETGANAGIIAIVRVLFDPTMLAEASGETAFHRDPTKFTGPRLRVRVRVDKVVDPRLSRRLIAQDDVARTLHNFKFANGTNYPVTPAQAAALGRLLAASPNEPLSSPPTPIGRAAGWVFGELPGNPPGSIYARAMSEDPTWATG